MRKDNSIYNKNQPGLYIYLYLQSQIPTSCYSGKISFLYNTGFPYLQR